MTTETALVVTDEVDDIRAKLETVRQVLAPDLSDHELQLFALVAHRSGLDPFAKQIYAVKRNGKVTFQTGIDGYRSTAARTNEYDGSDEPEFGDIIPTPFAHPEWARVTVYRLRPDGSRAPQSATAWWNEFYPGESQGHMWKKMPRNQLAKCAEGLALRKRFPYVLSDIYTDTEMEQSGSAENTPLVEAASQPTARERIAARRHVIEHDATETAEPPTPPEIGDAVAARALTKAQFVAVLDEYQIPTKYAATVRRDLFPDETSDLSDAQRGELLTALLDGMDKPQEAPTEPLTDDEKAAIGSGLAG